MWGKGTYHWIQTSTISQKHPKTIKKGRPSYPLENQYGLILNYRNIWMFVGRPSLVIDFFIDFFTWFPFGDDTHRWVFGEQNHWMSPVNWMTDPLQWFQLMGVSSSSWGYPNSWMVYRKKIPVKYRWFGGTPIYGNLHIIPYPSWDDNTSPKTMANGSRSIHVGPKTGAQKTAVSRPLHRHGRRRHLRITLSTTLEILMITWVILVIYHEIFHLSGV